MSSFCYIMQALIAWLGCVRSEVQGRDRGRCDAGGQSQSPQVGLALREVELKIIASCGGVDARSPGESGQRVPTVFDVSC